MSLLPLLFGVLCCTAVVATVVPAPEGVVSAAAPVDIPRVMEGMQEGHGLSIVTLSGEGAELKPFSRFGATALLGWNAEGLLAQIRVVDATPREAPDLEHLYDGDSVELYLAAPGDPAKGMVQLVVSPGRDPAHPAVRQRLFDYRGADLKKRGPTSGRATARRTADGYVVDLVIPWDNLGMIPAAGQVIGARIGVNDGEVGKERARLLWITPTAKRGDFYATPLVRLTEQTITAASPAAVAWGDYDDQAVTHVHVVADSGLAGKRVVVQSAAGEKRAEGELKRDGERAAVSLTFPAPLPGQSSEGTLSILIDGKPLDSLTLPDIAASRRDLFRASVSGEGRRRVPTGASLDFRSAVFSGSQFPDCGYADRKRIERLLGPVDIKTVFYDAAGAPVEKPSSPGRYGAVITATAYDLGQTVTGYRTLFRRPDGVAGVAEKNPVQAAATFEKVTDAEKADRDWWHALRKRLGTAVAYEYYVRVPAGYDADTARRWPVIFYLHGSGGGDANSWDKVKVGDGPQGAAGRDPDHFPFVVVSLRSPGGWYPPAVRDVMDEVQAKYRIDSDREYLTGFSMGAMGSWNVAYDQPNRFAAVAPVGGRTGDPSRMPLLKGVPVWIFNGAEDNTTTPADARAAAESLRATGATGVKYTEIPGAGHVESHEKAYADRAFYEWLLQQHRGS